MVERDLPLIRLLSDGEFHSGESLGACLDISRAGIWKRIKRLSDYALDVESVKGRGYRIAGGLSLLDRNKVMAHAGLDEAAVSLVIASQTSSTNADALGATGDALAKPYAALAEYQSAGRGRRGRVWQSPFASSISLSVAAQFVGGGARLEGLSLAVGVAVAELLRSEGVVDAALKWPNDILVDGAKLGGILIELAGDLDTECRAVIGVGLNGSLPSTFAVDQPVTDLYSILGRPIDRSRWAGLLLRALVDMIAVFSQHGFAPFRARWETVDGLRDALVSVSQGDVVVSGRAKGVTDRGALLLEVADGKVIEFHGGEVSVRRVGQQLPIIDGAV